MRSAWCLVLLALIVPTAASQALPEGLPAVDAPAIPTSELPPAPFATGPGAGGPSAPPPFVDPTPARAAAEPLVAVVPAGAVVDVVASLPLNVTGLWLLAHDDGRRDPLVEDAGPVGTAGGGGATRHERSLLPVEPPAVAPDPPQPARRAHVPDPMPPTLDPSQAGTTIALGATALVAIAARLYSRFAKADVLAAQPRAKLRDLIAEDPGATLPELMERMDLSRGALVHHARMLERHGVVASRHDGLHRRFYLAGPKIGDLLRPPTPGARRVLEVLGAEGPLTQAQLAERLGVTVQAANYHIVRLRREARVDVHVEGGHTKWVATRDERADP